MVPAVLCKPQLGWWRRPRRPIPPDGPRPHDRLSGLGPPLLSPPMSCTAAAQLGVARRARSALWGLRGPTDIASHLRWWAMAVTDDWDRLADMKLKRWPSMAAALSPPHSAQGFSARCWPAGPTHRQGWRSGGTAGAELAVSANMVFLVSTTAAADVILWRPPCLLLFAHPPS